MGFRKRIIAAAGVLAAVGVLAAAALSARQLPGVSGDNVLFHRPTITLWYTDEKLEDYLASVSLDYLDAYGVRVLPVLTDGLEYLEAVNEASLNQENAPDLYIVSNDSLEKAYLAGLAVPLGDMLNTDSFPQTALDAVCYQGERVAYPLYFETSALIYNRTYLEQAAQELGTDWESLVPSTIEDVLTFASEYNAPEQVEAVLRWDVSDFFYNYFFAGNYIDMGGSCGDDPKQIDIYNLEAVRGLAAYQNLSQFFSIDAAASSYDRVVQDFLDGKLVFTLATTDILGRVQEAKDAESFPYEYGVARLPDINEEICSRGVSVTYGTAVNGYSEKREEAEQFAAWLSTEGAEKLYDRTGLVPASRAAAQKEPEQAAFWEEYAVTSPMPKMMRTSNFWVQMEIATTKIWEGENVSDILKGLSEAVMTQVAGEPYTETEYIEVPSEEETQGMED
ncbi:MAG: extracellular solute-binding protein [Eubacteriales bacterium]|nr:extracellular solute-binding protein [Eubacteriales bacterium]